MQKRRWVVDSCLALVILASLWRVAVVSSGNNDEETLGPIVDVGVQLPVTVLQSVGGVHRSRKALGFLGTPTLMLTQASGVISDIAFGALGESRAAQFKAKLRGETSAQPLRLPFSIKELSTSGTAAGGIGLPAR